MGAASKAKGSNFEREVCKKLSLWITQGEKADCFWRSAMSGGRATVASKRGRDVRQAGDITAVAPEGHKLTDHVFIECKHYADLQLPSFMLSGTGNLARFWAVACKEAEKRRKVPWLIAKQNRLPTMLITSYESGSEVTLNSNDSVAVISRAQCLVWLFDEIVAANQSRKRERLVQEERK